MFGLFDVFKPRECFQAPANVFRADVKSPTYYADSLLTSSTVIELDTNSPSRAASGKEITTKLQNFKASDPAGYAAFDKALRANDGQLEGDLGELMRDHTSVVAANLDRIKAGQPVADVIKDMQTATANTPSERRSAPATPVTRESMARTLEPYRAEPFKNMYPDVTGGGTTGGRTPYQPQNLPQMGFPIGSTGPVTNPAWGGGRFNMPFNPGATFDFQNLFRALLAPFNGGGDNFGAGFRDATGAQQRYATPEVLQGAPSMRQPFNMAGNPYAGILNGINSDNSMRMGSIQPPGMAMGGGFGGGLQQTNPLENLTRTIGGIFKM